MKQRIGILAVIIMVVLVSGFYTEQSKNSRRTINLWEWDFKMEEDSIWRPISIPHDWSIEGEYSLAHGSDWQNGYLPAGLGYYQKTINIDVQDLLNKRILIEFEGVYENSSFYVNEQLIGTRPNGYVSFYYDITHALHAGSNVLKVKVDRSKPNSGRWYTGSGIYRPVNLHFLNKTHTSLWSPYIYTTAAKDGNASVKAEYEVNIDQSKKGKIQATIEVFSPQGELVVNQVSNTMLDQKINFDFQVDNAEFWSAERPSLYIARFTLKRKAEVLDVSEASFGIRTVRLSADSGLFINDVPTKIKGVCMHHGAGSLGAAVPVPVVHRRLKLLKEMGCNAIRTSHNPFAPSFYNMCDSMGFMVMNEAFDGWEQTKAESDYGLYFEDWWQKDLTDFVKRDRNHPSVIFWSIGNEVQKPTTETQQKLIDTIKSLDETRPITQGGIDPTRGMLESGESFQLDIKGFNGDGEEKNAFEQYHERNPTHPIIGTEVPHTYQTRGVYRTKTHWRRRDFPAPWEVASGSAGTMRGLVGKVYLIDDLSDVEVFPEEKQTRYFKDGEYRSIVIKNKWQPYLYYQSSYDNATVRSSARKAWQRANDLPFVIGQFRWTGFDYLGETNKWPSRFANFGIIDICGFPKDHYYLYQSLWSEKPSLHMLPHWTHLDKQGVEIPVVVYTNCDSVALSLNKKSLGTQRYAGEQLVWQVPFEEGVLEAQAYQGGSIILKKQIQTAGEGYSLGYKLFKDRDLKGDFIYQVELSIQDMNGVEVPYAENLLSFSLRDASWMGAENGDPLDLTAPRSQERKAFRGKAFCVFSASTDQNPVLEIKSENLKSLIISEFARL